ncbi:MAG: hypothetical protein AB4911_06315 [Oscillochloridaceae bacterium umkhey_bin13]
MLDAAFGWANWLATSTNPDESLALLGLIRSHPATERHLLRQIETMLAGRSVPQVSPADAEAGLMRLALP